MSYFIDGPGNYYEGDRQIGSVSVPQRPTAFHVFDGQAWVVDAPLVWADMSARIKLERDRRTDTGGYRVGAVWFHSDQKSRSQQLGLLALGANIPSGLRWKTMDGSYVDMTPGLAQQILVAAAASDIAIFAAAEAHIAALEGSDDPAGYDFSGGWPPMFGE